MTAQPAEVTAGAADEAGLVERARRMEDSAWRQIYDAHYTTIYAYLYYRTGSVPLAEEMAAEVFERAVRGIGSFTYRGTTIGAWLQRIAGNLLIDHYRRRSRAQPPVQLDEQLAVQSSSLSRNVELAETLAQLQQALVQLTEEQQQVILMRFVNEMSTAEVARQLHKSEGAVKTLQHRALDRLRRLWPTEREP